VVDNSAKIVSEVGTAAGSSNAQAKPGLTFMHVPDPRHPLEAAFARVKRAEEHLAALLDRAAIREREQVHAFGLNPHPTESKQIVLDVGPGIKLPIDFMFAILVGEICYNLRSALDYLVYELAILDSGAIKRTQFPIEKNAAAFTARRKPGNFLDGINDAHVAAIGKLQPYMGSTWTANLQDISNPDKHRTLVGISGRHNVQVDTSDNRQKLEGHPGTIRSAATMDGTVIFVRLSIATIISFADGTAVIEPLQKISEEVERALNYFRPEFG
jgi:hypothetical protein